MLFELTLLPINNPTDSSSQLIADAIKIIHYSGLPYQLNATSTCVEGEWDQVFGLFKKCVTEARKISPHIVAMIKVEDDGSSQSKITSNVNSVASKLTSVTT